MKYSFFICFFCCLTFSLGAQSSPLNVLIIDGQNNHEHWPKITAMMKSYLEQTGRFTVDVRRTAYTWKGESFLDDFPAPEGHPPTQIREEPTQDPNYQPDFSGYDVVISNFGWRATALPTPTQIALEQFVGGGGGLVIVHAADNSWPDWTAFNRMIGLGGWGNRNEKDGPYVYYNDDGVLIRNHTPGPGGHHGPQREFPIIVRDGDHPITHNMPSIWLHAKDELYDQLRGPAENMHILTTAYADRDQGGSGRHEPVLMTINFGSGRVFHTTLGHADYSWQCVGLITAFQRGTEWAATGTVSDTELPDDFPTNRKVKTRDWRK